MRTRYPILLALIICFLFPPGISFAELSSEEKLMIESAKEPYSALEKEDIILVWPKNLKPNWYYESRVKTPQDMADWLEKAYQLSVFWTGFDPNAKYEKDNKEKIRLIFIHNGGGDFIFGGKRPFIGLRALNDPVAGSEDWFGWLTHELSHDFWHQNPMFTDLERETWGEGMCDFERYWLLKEMKMPQAARRWEQLLRSASDDDAYKGAAWILMSFQREHYLETPKEFWGFVRAHRVETIFPRPKWAK